MAAASASQPAQVTLHPRLAAVERMAPERFAGIEAVRRQHRALMADGAALARLDAAVDALDANSLLARVAPSSAELAARAALVRQVAPDEASRLREACARAKAHRFQLLGTPLMPLEERLDWHRDYRVNKRYRADVDYLALGRDAFPLLVDREHEAELKFVWDLNNLHWVPSLAAGRFLLGDAACVGAFAADWQHWMEANPPFLGVNWFCPMNVAMRAANAVVGLGAFAGELDPALVRRSLRCLLRHGLGIMGHLEVETAAKRNNHYLTNVMGMYLLGWMFRDLDLGAQWLAFASAELEAEVRYQFNPDGVCFEDSTAYHRLSTEMLLLCAITARRNHAELSPEYHRRLRAALHFTRGISGPDGRIPQFGDNDNGRILQFHGYGSVASTDQRHLLAVGGGFYDDDDLRRAGLGAESDACWLLGAWQDPAPAAPRRESLGWAQGGFHVHRAPQGVLTMRSGAISLACAGGHAHCDQLAFTLHTARGPLFVDGGSYRYSSDFAARNAFRSVAWHNTVQIDDLPMHEYDPTTFEGLWWMIDQAACTTLAAGEDGDGWWRFRGRHHAFAAANCLVERELAWQPGAGRLLLSDRICAADPARPLAATTRAASRLLLAPGLDVRWLESGRLAIEDAAGVAATLTVPAGVAARVRQRWFSPGYGSREPALQLEFTWAPAAQPVLELVIVLG